MGSLIHKFLYVSFPEKVPVLSVSFPYSLMPELVQHLISKFRNCQNSARFPGLHFPPLKEIPKRYVSFFFAKDALLALLGCVQEFLL